MPWLSSGLELSEFNFKVCEIVKWRFIKLCSEVSARHFLCQSAVDEMMFRY